MSNETNNKDDMNGEPVNKDPHAHYWFWGWMVLFSLIAMCLMTLMLLGFGQADLLKDLLLFASGLVSGVGATVIVVYRK